MKQPVTKTFDVIAYQRGIQMQICPSAQSLSHEYCLFIMSL
jgi:hypothetical protein